MFKLGVLLNFYLKGNRKLVFLSIQVVDNPEKVRILLDETRNKIICMLGRGSMSLSELARALNKTPATVFHHIKKLVSVDLIKLERTRVVNNNLVEKYYSLVLPSSCLIGIRVPRPERGPVPPRRLSKVDSRGSNLCPDIWLEDVFEKIGLELEGKRREQCINIMKEVYERASFEAGEAFKEVAQQIDIKLLQDRRVLQPLARAIPILTFCKMLEKPENLRALKDLLQSFHS
jgi:DNA-binding transcriptional ArsR family regulator